MNAPGHAPGERDYTRISVALFLAGVATFATLYCTQPLLPVLSAHFRVSPADAALSVSLSTITLGIALLFMGPISDRIGRTGIMTGSLLASGVVTIVTALVDDWHLLLGLRALLGTVVAGLPAVAVAYLREEIHPAYAGRATGLYIGGTALGGMSGRLICGVLADLFDWRVAIAGIGLVALGCGIAVRVLLPASRQFVPSELRPSQLTRSVAAIMRDPVMIGLQLVAALAMGSFVAVFNVMGYRLEAAPYHLSVGVAGMLFLVYSFGSVSSARAGRLAERHGQPRVVMAGLALQLLGVLVTAFGPLPLIVLGLALVTIGFFAAHGVASGWVAAHAVAAHLGTGQSASLYLFFYYLGSSVAGTAAGWAWSTGRWPAVTLLTGSMLVAAVAAAGWAGHGTSRVRPRRN